MKLYLRNATRGFGLDMVRFRRSMRRLMSAVGEQASSISVSFVRDAEIAELNGQFRGKPQPTDVLSFPIDGEGESLPDIERMLGDIIISLDTAVLQAHEYDATLDAEVERLLIHGLLHLLGHDHELPDERAAMEAQERRLADVIGLPWPYLHGDR